MTVTLHFHGAAGTVTGSCYRVVHPGGQFLVDCGLFQGNKSVRDLNLKPTPGHKTRKPPPSAMARPRLHCARLEPARTRR